MWKHAIRNTSILTLAIPLLYVGLAIFSDIHGFYQATGIDPTYLHPGLINELKGTGFLVLICGLMIAVSLWLREWQSDALKLSAFIYLCIATGRIFSFATDGVPNDSLVTITVLEVSFGTLSLFILGLLQSES